MYEGRSNFYELIVRSNHGNANKTDVLTLAMPVKLLSCVYGSFVIPQRYVLCLMTFFGVVVSYCTRVCLNIAITEMVVPLNTTKILTIQSSTCPQISKPIAVKGGTFNWTQEQQGLILGAFFPGYVLTHLPGGILADKYGGKHVLASGVAVSAVLSLLTPLSTKYNGWFALATLRFVMGLAQGPLFPSMTTLLAKWAPQNERSTLGAFVTAGIHVGSILGNFVSSMLMIYWGTWTSVFYVWGVAAVVWCLIFYVTCYSEPALHPFITAKEAMMLEEKIGATEKMDIPWKSILLSSAVWAIVVGEIGHDWLFFLIVVELPSYMSAVLKFNIAENGIWNTMPYVVLWVSSTLSAIAADVMINKNCMSVVNVRRLFTTIGSVIPVIFLVIASYMDCQRSAVVAMFLLCMIAMSPIYAGLRINTLDITKNFAGIVMGLVNGLGAVGFVPVPWLIPLVTHDNTIEEWRLIFWLVFIGRIFTNVVYVIWASGDREEWDKSGTDNLPNSLT